MQMKPHKSKSKMEKKMSPKRKPMMERKAKSSVMSRFKGSYAK